MPPFLDTNVLVYAFSTCDKSDRARQFMFEPFIISAQVLNEFANVSHNKQKRSWDDVEETVTIVIQQAKDIRALTARHSLQAVAVAQRYQVHIYDALIIAAALDAGCNTLLSEDMQDGLVIEGRLTVLNPFKD